MSNIKLVNLIKDKVRQFKASKAFSSGCSFSDYLFDYYTEHPYNIPSEYENMDLEEACYCLAELVEED